jgi:hypothetical protein
MPQDNHPGQGISRIMLLALLKKPVLKAVTNNHRRNIVHVGQVLCLETLNEAQDLRKYGQSEDPPFCLVALVALVCNPAQIASSRKVSHYQLCCAPDLLPMLDNDLLPALAPAQESQINRLL